jgi:hypothetical protein
MDEYALAEDLGGIFSVISLALIFLGEYLRHDGYSNHDLVGKIAEGVGWASWGLLSIVGSQRAAEAQVECSVFERGCPTSLGSWFWEFVQPLLLDGLLGVAAGAAGWALAKLTRRRPTQHGTNQGR